MAGTAIVTGFEPFGPYQFNPTADLANALNGQMVSGMMVTGIVLPATYDTACLELLAACKQFGPTVVLSLGLSLAIPRIRVENQARNEKGGKYADKLGVVAHGEKIDQTGSDYLCVNTDAGKLALALVDAGVDAEVSYNADAFVCNALIYHMMMAIRTGAIKTLYSFVHIPWPECYLDRIQLEAGKITVPWQALEATVASVLAQPFPRSH